MTHVYQACSKMSQITIGSFGEQTLDALLEAENSNNKKQDHSQYSKPAVNSKFQKSSFVPLQEINENLIANYSKSSGKETTNDYTNIDKHFQDSIELSKTGTHNLQNITNHSEASIHVNKNIDELTNSNNKAPIVGKARSTKKTSVGTKRGKKCNAAKPNEDHIDLQEEVFIIDTSDVEVSNKNSHSSTKTDSTSKDATKLKRKINVKQTSTDHVSLLDKKYTNLRKSRSKKNSVQLSSSNAVEINNLLQKTASTAQNSQIEGASQANDCGELPHSNTVERCTDSVARSSNDCSIVRTQDRCRLSAWGLPANILQKYESRGMEVMFPWQAECLSNYQVLEENKNLVYSAPTSAGKTLVAEILVIKTVLERQKKAIFILPFVSVVREKMFYFQDLLSNCGVRVAGFMGGIAPPGGFSAAHIAIATIEKANSLINRLMEEGDLSSLGTVVVDELHLLGDPHRGYLLELLLTKLKYMTLREEHVNIQLIGMSATLPNLPLLAEWLDAELFSTQFRPVPLNEQYKIHTKIYDSKFVPVRELHPSPELPNDSDNILQLCIETIADGHSTLIFCPTKNWCEKLAHQVAAIFFKLGNSSTVLGQVLRKQLNSNAIEETLSQLQRCPAGLDNVLKSTVSFGVAFHHAGLTMDERDIIEGSFRTGSLRILIATSTLSSGVNLPARRVIIRSLMFHGKVIDTLTYRQMIGRAGRMGKDTAGESILICKPNEKFAAESLLSAPLDPVQSCLEGSGPLIRALLEAVASEVACTTSEIDLYSRCTLASFSPVNNVKRHTMEAMEFLTSNEFIIAQETKKREQQWVASALGKACLASSVSPGDGLFLFEELQRARKCFVLETELHIIYLVTPFNSGGMSGQIDWMIFFNLWKSLSDSERRVGEMVGIEERFLMSAIRGVTKCGKQHNIHKRFFTALALHDLVREISLTTVSEKYGCSRGVLQSLQQSASTFAGMVTQFCKQLGWDCMELLFCQFQTRLQFGVCRELLDLLRLPMLNGLRARSLYKEGIKSVADLASADELSVERALHKALPFESEKEQDGEHMLDAAKRNRVRSIFVTGRDGLTPYQAAVMLVQEARTLVQHELGVEGVNWKQDNKESSTLAIISYDKSSLSASCGPNSNHVNNQCSTNIAPQSESASASRKDFDKSCAENSRNIDEVSKPNNGLPNLIGKSEVCGEASSTRSIINEPHSGRVASIQEEVDKNAIASDPLTVQTDAIVSKQQTDRTEKSSNGISTNKPKFNLLGTKRKSHRILNSTKSVSNVNSKEIVAVSVNASSPKISGDSLSLLESSHEVTNDMKPEYNEVNVGLNINVKSAVTEVKAPTNIENVTNVITEEENASEIVEMDLKLSMSPMVSLEWLSLKEIISAKGSINDPKTFPKPEISAKENQQNCFHNNESKVSLSRSPSLFGDSLYLDTQFCNELEKNITDSSNIGKTEAIDLSATNRSSASMRKSDIELRHTVNSPAININPITNTSKNKFSFNANRSCAIVQNPEPKYPNTSHQIAKSEEIDFSWNSTTWDDWKGPKNASDELNQCVKEEEITNVGKSKDQSHECQTSSGQVKSRRTPMSNDFDMSNEIVATPVIEKSHLKSISVKSNIKYLRNLKITENSDSRKRKFNEIHSLSDSSPILNIVNLTNNRRFSVESNKSDSDDLVVASQNVESIKSAGKSRTRLKLELSKKVVINKKQGNCTLADSSRQSNSVNSKNIKLLRTGDTRPKKLLYQENHSTDSVVSNSEEESPVPKLRVTQSLHKRTLNSSFIIQKVENLRKCKKRCLKTNVNTEHSSLTQTVDWNILDIINVASNDEIFKSFKHEVKQKTDIAIALARDKFVNDTVGIGSKLLGVSTSHKKSRLKKNESCVHLDTIINGVAISWGRNVVYYISLENKKEGSISLKERLQLLRDILENSSSSVRCYGSKETYKKLHRCCRITSNCTFLDPKVAEWLLHPETNERSLHEMANIYFQEGVSLLEHATSLKASVKSTHENEQFCLSRHRATAEAAVSWHVMEKMLEQLRKQSVTLLYVFKDVEAKVESILARMELTGIGINLQSLQELSAVLQQEMSSLEQRAYSLARRKFSFTSSKDVAQALGMYKGAKVSTNKAVLENSDNPISKLVISWRKLNTTQTKLVFPLLNWAQQEPRVRGCWVTRTATGRVSMHEPNLQNVPRDFNSENNSFVISMRMAFVPTFGNIMLSADYCQLELRILAHFSQDPVLCEIMKRDSDIFKNIAAQWNNIPIEEVKDDIRHRTKQLCYGIIYGMGSKTLAKQLSVTELEANKFMETFMGTYPNINNWLDKVTTQSREDGYVTTLMERRRPLPGINSELQSERSQAERQAVNTKIQGSAADLAKKAMVLIDEKLQQAYPDVSKVLSEPKTRKLRSSKDSHNRGAYLVLQLHDELLYEVNAEDLNRIAAIVKTSMEEAYQLSIPLPVKIKVGPTWGSLTEYNI